MRNLYIKYNLPGVQGAIRFLGLYLDSVKKGKLLPGSEFKIQINNRRQDFKVKLDYWSSKLVIPEGDSDVYVTIALKGKNIIQRFFYSFSPKALSICIVAKSDYESFDSSYYGEKSKLLIKIDSVSFLLTTAVLIYLLYTIFSSAGVPDDTSHLIWATTIIGATTLLIIWKDRQSISVFTYKSRMILLAVLLIVVLFTLTIQDYISLGWLITLIPVTVLLRTLVIDQQSNQTL